MLDDYQGNLAEMLKSLPPKLTKKEKDKIKACGNKILEELRPVVV